MESMMGRFLNKYFGGLDGLEDLDFDVFERDPVNRSRWIMAICKEKPWEFENLSYFIEGLANVNFEYTLRFSYRSRPGLEDALYLFGPWYFQTYRQECPYSVENDGKTLIFCFTSDEEKKARTPEMLEFASLIKWLCYDVEMKAIVSEKPIEHPKSALIQEEKVEEPLQKANQFVHEENVLPEQPAYEEDVISSAPDFSEEEEREALRQEIEKEKEENLAAAESQIVEDLEANEKAYLAAKERERINKRGNYRHIESLEDLYTMEAVNVDFDAYVFQADYRAMRNGRHRLNFSLHDDKSAISCNLSENKNCPEEMLKKVKPGEHYRVRGAICEPDNFNRTRTIRVHYLDRLPDKKLKEDPYEGEKRVELHLHTKMSTMDGVTDIKDYIKQAKAYGMKAIAVTDHGCVQSFPDAQDAAAVAGLNVVYGCELYSFSEPWRVLNPAPIKLDGARYCVFDLETTGLSFRYDKITMFGGLIIDNGTIVARKAFFVNPGIPIPKSVAEKTHISDEMVASEPPISARLKEIEDFMKGSILVSHNAPFDTGFLNEARREAGLPPMDNPVIDTLVISQFLFPNATRHNLTNFGKHLGLDIFNDDEEEEEVDTSLGKKSGPLMAHRADDDAEALAQAWMAALSLLLERRKDHNLTHEELGKLESDPEDKVYRRFKSFHTTVLCKDKQGLSDLYRLITESNLTYLAEVPKIPKSEIAKYRSHLLVGSSCQNSELFEIARRQSKEELEEAVKFYDYIEIQPIDCYTNLIYENMSNTDNPMEREQEYQKGLSEVKRTIKDIYDAARKANRLIVATGDVHYLNEEDKIIRDIFISTFGINHSRHPLNPYFRSKKSPYPNPNQHLRSTSEMLEIFKEYEFLSEAEIKEIVIDNTVLIASWCENLEPVMPGTFPPNANYPTAAKELRELVEKNFAAKYGDNPPQELRDRIEAELKGIIDNGYSVTYMIAYKIIKEARDQPEHYIVGSRGSVGSSFVATMADITEVNPLAPHYLCPHCHHFEWGNGQYPNIRSGFDLPEKKCPECGHDMFHDGQNIPFQTFLGFHAEKVPDIDLNFPPDYQGEAHKYMRTLMGENNVFRAGTIETVAEKTAFRYVRDYYENILHTDPFSINGNWVAYLASRCAGVKRTTGQHPGGIVCIPADHDKFEFTPIQYPAEKSDSEWMTTHYDFGSMHDELLKIDLLGHIDPLATRLLSLISGVDLFSIPMNDKKVLSLFNSVKPLGLSENYLGQKVGTLGIPEFGTNLAQQMLETSSPKTFNDLLIISGLAHGTEVWTNNAEDLIKNGITNLEGVIGCRDDIMNFLISKEVPSSVSFKIMEAVRKGRGLTPEQAQMMVDHGVPDYYINSCRKIHYLFPRAHATAYVMMAIRVGYFKVYYPLEFYAVFFSVRSDDWDIITMSKGKEAIRAKLEEYKRRRDNRDPDLKPKDDNINKTLRVAMEMAERGYGIEMIDINRSDATMFTVDKKNNAILAPFSIVDGLGEAAARSIVEARKERPFLSQEDLLSRTSITTTNLQFLAQAGALGDLPETNQMDLFSFFDLN